MIVIIEFGNSQIYSKSPALSVSCPWYRWVIQPGHVCASLVFTQNQRSSFLCNHHLLRSWRKWSKSLPNVWPFPKIQRWHKGQVIQQYINVEHVQMKSFQVAVGTLESRQPMWHHSGELMDIWSPSGVFSPCGLFHSPSCTRSYPSKYSNLLVNFDFATQPKKQKKTFIIPARDPKQCVRGGVCVKSKVWHIISGPADLSTLK